MAPLPPLPPSLNDPRPVVGAGIVAALLAAGLLALLGVGATAVWSCLAGGGLGLLGLAIIQWQQRAASRRSEGLW